MNVGSVLHVLGRLCFVLAALLLLPLLVVVLDGEPAARPGAPFDEWGAFLAAAAAAAAVGLLLSSLFRFERSEFDDEEGFAVVATCWLLFAALGSLPFVLTGEVPSWLDASFETLSGFTTTGASILADPAALGHPLLFWRALTHWVGGMGIIALSVAILPALGAGGAFLYRAEAADPDRGNLMPRIKDTAQLLWGVYVGLTALETLALWAAGMSFFDAICHSFATVATGGFGTRADSLAGFGPAVQWVATLFMFLSGLNLLLLLACVRGRPRELLRSTEARVWVCVLLVACGICTAVLHGTPAGSRGLEPLLRDVVSTVVSICTTTGFVTADYELWPVSLHVVIVLLMIVGACSGSTSGSAKVARHIMWAKGAWREVRRLLRPDGVFLIKVDGHEVRDVIVARSISFLLLYLGSAVLGVLALTLLGLSASAALGATVTCLSGVGPGLAELGPSCNFGDAPAAAKVVLMACMLLGRLEFFAIVALCSPLAWRR